MVKQAAVEVSSNRQWWQSLGDDEECPITLESLASLPYPPFSLATDQHNNNNNNNNSVVYFDGVALASYIVSRGIFENPLTRQELSAETCKRLDDHLNEHCSNHLRGIGGGRQISVAEAHALRSIVHVEERGGGGGGNYSNETTRARVLRNTATAALAGLFVYGNDRRRQQQQQQQQQQQTNSNAAELPREDRLILEWGFDLSKTVEETAEYGGNGWTVIDDDEALVVASKREAYQAAQNAFPQLSDSCAEGGGTTSARDVDAQLLGRVRQMAVHEEESQAQKERRLQLARQQLLQEALQRREERKRENTMQLKKVMEQSLEKRKEAEELEKTRTEIAAWRNEQWERLRAISESFQQKEKAREESVSVKKDPQQPKTGRVSVQMEEQTTEENTEEQKKAKAAAKRKRAKARKKAQKAEETAKLEAKKKEEEILAKKAASAVLCAACGQGVVDCGFEKFDQKFCSPKCARTAVRIP
jgi:hypothetical protein